MGLILARQIGTFVSVLLCPLFFCECGGREQTFRDGAEVKTVNGQIVLRPVIQGKALSTTPVTSARERSPQWHKFGFNCTFDEQIMSGVLVHINKIAHSFWFMQTMMIKRELQGKYLGLNTT